MDERSETLGWMISYLVQEDFPQKNLDALKTIISTFNYNESGEVDILEFAEILRKKYPQR